jgi:hypothetical protein
MPRTVVAVLSPDHQERVLISVLRKSTGKSASLEKREINFCTGCTANHNLIYGIQCNRMSRIPVALWYAIFCEKTSTIIVLVSMTSEISGASSG